MPQKHRREDEESIGMFVTKRISLIMIGGRLEKMRIEIWNHATKRFIVLLRAFFLKKKS